MTNNDQYLPTISFYFLSFTPFSFLFPFIYLTFPISFYFHQWRIAFVPLFPRVVSPSEFSSSVKLTVRVKLLRFKRSALSMTDVSFSRTLLKKVYFDLAQLWFIYTVLSAIGRLYLFFYSSDCYSHLRLRLKTSQQLESCISSVANVLPCYTENFSMNTFLFIENLQY